MNEDELRFDPTPELAAIQLVDQEEYTDAEAEVMRRLLVEVGGACTLLLSALVIKGDSCMAIMGQYMDACEADGREAYVGLATAAVQFSSQLCLIESSIKHVMGHIDDWVVDKHQFLDAMRVIELNRSRAMIMETALDSESVRSAVSYLNEVNATPTANKE